MKYVDLALADAYYSVARDARLSWRRVANPVVEEFSRAVLDLSRLAKTQDDDTGWREFLYQARRARRIATTVPLPLWHPALEMGINIDRLERSMRALRVYGGDDAGQLGERILAAGQALLSLEGTPLLDAVLDASQGEEQGAPTGGGLLLPTPEYTAAVGEFITAMHLPQPLKVLSRHDIVGADPLARLVIVGPLYMYEESQYVLTSPRARQMVVLQWAWYREQPPTVTALDGSRGAAGLKVEPVPIPAVPVQVGADDERPIVNWQAISQRLRSGESDPSEPVAARIAVLAGRYAVFLPEDGDRPVWLLDPHAPPEHRVARVGVADLEPGHVIVLRTSGGGDLIVPIADEILGHEAPELRQLQHRWKARLREWVLQRGTIPHAAADLRRAGCARANPQNLQNWLGERSLRTEDRHDWQVLMAAVSLGADAEKVWRAMGKLNSAHLEAGKSILRRLREMANTQPLDTLLASGRQVFELARGGSVAAFRIEGFSPAPVQCAPSQLMVPAKVSDAWLT